MFTTGFVNLYTCDIKAGLRFYRDRLGFEETFRPRSWLLRYVGFFQAEVPHVDRRRLDAARREGRAHPAGGSQRSSPPGS
jgi:lactoylglutathione lyase